MSKKQKKISKKFAKFFNKRTTRNRTHQEQVNELRRQESLIRKEKQFKKFLYFCDLIKYQRCKWEDPVYVGFDIDIKSIDEKLYGSYGKVESMFTKESLKVYSEVLNESFNNFKPYKKQYQPIIGSYIYEWLGEFYGKNYGVDFSTYGYLSSEGISMKIYKQGFEDMKKFAMYLKKECETFLGLSERDKNKILNDINEKTKSHQEYMKKHSCNQSNISLQ